MRGYLIVKGSKTERKMRDGCDQVKKRIRERERRWEKIKQARGWRQKREIFCCWICFVRQLSSFFFCRYHHHASHFMLSFLLYFHVCSRALQFQYLLSSAIQMDEFLDLLLWTKHTTSPQDDIHKMMKQTLQNGMEKNQSRYWILKRRIIKIKWQKRKMIPPTHHHHHHHRRWDTEY